jgi:DNA-binding phage protein
MDIRTIFSYGAGKRNGIFNSWSPQKEMARHLSASGTKMASLLETRGKQSKSNVLTREYRQTVLARIKRDPKFARALYAEAVNALLEGETDEGLSILRDLVHASITFKKLAEQTGFGEKTLRRMLSQRGNPTTRNLFVVTKAISKDLGIKPQIKLAA